MIPPLSKRFRIFDFLDKPIDFDKTFNSKRIFGAHKTWRGAIAGISIGVLISYVQAWLYQYSFIKQISLINYQNINILFFGLLISFGAVLGDLFFAFIKRRLDLKPGTKFIPFDQINYVIGVYVILSLTDSFKIDKLFWIIILISTFFLHVIVNRIGYQLGFHKAKW